MNLFLCAFKNKFDKHSLIVQWCEGWMDRARNVICFL